MPKPIKTLDNIKMHLTKEQRQARQEAETSMGRKERTKIYAPDWLSEEARKVFDTTKRRMRSLQILDNADADLLALYSDAVARYRKAIKELDKATSEDTRVTTATQAWSRLALTYAEKLGISATGRARLAKKKAEHQPQDELERLLDDVTETLNDGR